MRQKESEGYPSVRSRKEELRNYPNLKEGVQTEGTRGFRKWRKSTKREREKEREREKNQKKRREEKERKGKERKDGEMRG